MLDILQSKNYMVISSMAVLALLLVFLNPRFLQNKEYTPNALYHGVILLAFGTGLFIFVNKYQCKALLP